MGILTEEELKDFVKEVIILKGLKIKSSMDLIKSHRHLLSANAELSFKNQKYKEFLSDQRIEDYELGNMKQLDRLNRFLEELK